MSSPEQLAIDIKAEALRLGFNACGISKSEQLDDEARRLEHWLNKGRHGTMAWMERNFEKRINPSKLVEGAKSVISVLHNYYQPVTHLNEEGSAKISRYAWGDDYHDVMKERLFKLYNWIEEQVGEISGRAFVDSAPVLDRAWAKKSGLGWVGKHSNLINRSLGSYFFIGELIIDVPLATDGPVKDYCGSCTRCIDACPTDAIYEPYVVDSNRCISYLTIEHRADDIEAGLQAQMGNWIFGCDVCQDVCPWNKFKKNTQEERYLVRDGMVETRLEEWLEIDLEAFRRQFRKNPVKRTKFEGFKRNVRMAYENLTSGSGAEGHKKSRS